MTRREANARSDPRWAFHESISEVKRKQHKHGSEGNTDRVCTARGRPTSRAKLWKVAHQSEWCNKAFLPTSTDAKFVSS